MEDLEAIYKNYWSSEKTATYMLWSPQKNLEDAKDRLIKTIEFQKNHLAFLIYEKSTNQPIGQAAMIEIEPGVYEDGGVGMGEASVGKGYGKQVLNGFLKYLFEELDAKKVICSCHTDNIPSARCQMACGLKYTHSEMYTRKKDGLTYKADYYEITKEEYFANKMKIAE